MESNDKEADEEFARIRRMTEAEVDKELIRLGIDMVPAIAKVQQALRIKSMQWKLDVERIQFHSIEVLSNLILDHLPLHQQNALTPILDAMCARDAPPAGDFIELVKILHQATLRMHKP